MVTFTQLAEGNAKKYAHNKLFFIVLLDPNVHQTPNVISLWIYDVKPLPPLSVSLILPFL